MGEPVLMILIGGIIVLLFGGFVLPMIFLQLYKPKLQQSFDLLIEVTSGSAPFSTLHNTGIGPGLIYCPHPFTNWSLNPGYLNSEKQIEHTREGFRKTEASDSIKELLIRKPSAKKIVCVGGSSTYCTELEGYQRSWPAKLREKLEENDFSVFNFGVGGWGTIASLTRCLTWLPVINPDVVVFYQAKNDLTPLMNGNQVESECYPDYQNLMVQFSQELTPKWTKALCHIPFFKLFAIHAMPKDLSCVYSKLSPDSGGLERWDETLRKGYVFRVETLAKMCNLLGAEMLFVSEIVKTSSYRQQLMDLYAEVHKSLCDYENVHIFEPDSLVPDEYFLDKMHFNEAGCELFSSLISNQIKKLL